MHDNSLNFTFPLEYVSFQVSMVSTGRMVQSIPAHAHGRGCYEIHYIRHGSGTVVIDGVPPARRTEYPLYHRAFHPS